jgi:glycosyltransferase involved in cell wall biosynthesis
MGEDSKDTMPAENRKPGSMHRVVPHFIYPVVPRLNKAESRKLLGIPSSTKVVLVFGDFRTDEEREMVLSIGKKLKSDQIKMIAPRLFENPIRGHGKMAAYRELRHRLHFLKYGLFLKRYSFVSDIEMSRLFSACDVVLIQRKRILNSGNVPMGFYFGKTVAGPDRGNVGEILRLTGNSVFDPENVDSAAKAVREAFALAEKGKGEENRRYAETYWTPEICARSIVNGYKSIMSFTS